MCVYVLPMHVGECVLSSPLQHIPDRSFAAVTHCSKHFIGHGHCANTQKMNFAIMRQLLKVIFQISTISFFFLIQLFAR